MLSAASFSTSQRLTMSGLLRLMIAATACMCAAASTGDPFQSNLTCGLPSSGALPSHMNSALRCMIVTCVLSVRRSSPRAEQPRTSARATATKPSHGRRRVKAIGVPFHGRGARVAYGAHDDAHLQVRIRGDRAGRAAALSNSVIPDVYGENCVSADDAACYIVVTTPSEGAPRHASTGDRTPVLPPLPPPPPPPPPPP